MRDVLRELGYSIRFARRHLGAYSALILTFAISVAATTTILSVMYFVFVRDLPYRDPASLVRVAKLFPQGNPESTNYAELLDWRARSTAFESLAAIKWEDATVLGGTSPERITAAVVTVNLFSMLGVRPLIGRTFGPSDEQAGAHVAVLMEGAWRQMFGANPNIVGRRVRLSTRNTTLDYQIVGVMPSAVRFYETPSSLSSPGAMFVAQQYPLPPSESDTDQAYVVFGRLKAGVSRGAARDDLTRVIHTAPSKFYSPGAYVVSMHEAEFGNNERVLLLLALTVGLVTLIACVNMAGLLLALGSARRREFAIRSAIGATRGRLVRQLLIEHAMLVSAGTAIGAWLTTLGLRAVTALSPAQLPRIDDVRISWQVFAIGCVLTASTAFVSGFLPVLLLSRSESFSTMKGTSSSGGHARWRDALVAVQLGLVFAVALVASLVLRSFWLLEHVNLGYEPHGVVAAQISLGPRWDVPGRPQVFQRHLLDTLHGRPAIGEVALAEDVPPTARTGGIYLRDGRIVWPIWNEVSPDYFHLLRIPTFVGKATGGDLGESAIVANQAFVRRFLSDASIVGQPLGEQGEMLAAVVGDTWHARQSTLTSEAAVYIDILGPQSSIRFWVLVRSASPEANAVAEVRRAVSSIDPNVPLMFTTLDAEVARARVEPRFLAVLLGGFGGFGLLLAAIGVFTGVHQSVIERLRELAIRIALGAEPRRIRFLMVERILALSAAAILVGGWIGSLGARGLRTMLFGITPNDLPTLFASAVLVAVVAMAAAWRPLRRAVSVDPVVLLREE